MIKKIIVHRDKIYLIKLASLQILVSFATNFYIVKKIGFNSELDILYISLSVFSFLTSSIGWSISSVLTPILIENREKKIEGEIFISIAIIVIPLFIIVMTSMFFWSKLIFVNYLNNVSFDKILIIQSMSNVAFLLATLNILFLSIFQEKNQYIKINFLNLISSIVGFLFVYFTIDNYTIYSAGAYQIIIQLFLFLIMGFMTYRDIKVNFRFNKNRFLLLWNRMKYIFFGSFYYRIGTIIDRFIASYFAAGTLSLIGFVEKIYGAIITVLNTSIAGPTITKFSNLIKEGKSSQIKRTLYNYLILLFVIDIVIFLVVLFFGENLFLYFFSDRIDEALIPVLPSVLLFLFAIVFGKTLGQILHNLLLSLRLEKKLTIFESLSFTISMLIKIIGAIYFGTIGFLLAILLSEMIKNSMKAYLVLIYLRRNNAIEI